MIGRFFTPVRFVRKLLMRNNGHYRFDLERARKALFCEYFIRLAQPINDLLSIQQLASIERAKMPHHVDVGLGTYLTKLQAAHLIEAYIAFVEKVQPRKGEAPSDLYISTGQ